MERKGRVLKRHCFPCMSVRNRTLRLTLMDSFTFSTLNPSIIGAILSVARPRGDANLLTPSEWGEPPFYLLSYGCPPSSSRATVHPLHPLSPPCAVERKALSWRVERGQVWQMRGRLARRTFCECHLALAARRGHLVCQGVARRIRFPVWLLGWAFSPTS